MSITISGSITHTGSWGQFNFGNDGQFWNCLFKNMGLELINLQFELKFQ